MTDSLHRRFRPIAVLLLLLLCFPALFAGSQAEPSRKGFAETVAELSEPGGDFDTDNLISNEKSYLHVVPELERRGVSGGVYIGVGPDQNFSYIARIRPKAAIIIDIRRDNLLLHLLFKALFAGSRNRAEYLCLLTGRPVPGDVEAWSAASLDKLVEYIDNKKSTPTAALDGRLHDAMQRFGVPLSAADLATIDRFHAAFVNAGLSLRFNSFGRQPQSYYPNYRDLLTETDRDGRKRGLFVSEPDFQFVRELESRDGVIPVVGDLGGTRALPAIARWIARRGETLSAFYVSNVENYLFQDDKFERYMENIRRIPSDSTSVVIRSIFGRFLRQEAVPGYYSASTLAPIKDLLVQFDAGKIRSYRELVGERR